MKGLWILPVIFKWIGIVLLAVLLLALLLVLLALFSPIRYRAEAEKNEELGVAFRVSWLLGALRCQGAFAPESGLELRLKLLWFTLIGDAPKEGKAKKAKKEKRKKRKKSPAREEPPTVAVSAREKAEPERPPDPEKPAPERMEPQQAKTFRRVALETVEEIPPESAPEEDETFFTGEPEDGEEPKKRIPPVVSRLLHMEGKKDILSALKKLLGRLLKGVLPGDFSLKGTFGTGDPTTTGYLLALAGVLTARFGDDIQVRGDFAKAGAEDVVFRVRGRIRLAYLLWAGLAFLLAKPVRGLLRMLWKMRKEL